MSKQLQPHDETMIESYSIQSKKVLPTSYDDNGWVMHQVVENAFVEGGRLHTTPVTNLVRQPNERIHELFGQYGRLVRYTNDENVYEPTPVWSGELYSPNSTIQTQIQKWVNEYVTVDEDGGYDISGVLERFKREGGEWAEKYENRKSALHKLIGRHLHIDWPIEDHPLWSSESHSLHENDSDENGFDHGIWTTDGSSIIPQPKESMLADISLNDGDYDDSDYKYSSQPEYSPLNVAALLGKDISSTPEDAFVDGWDTHEQWIAIRRELQEHKQEGD